MSIEDISASVNLPKEYPNLPLTLKYKPAIHSGFAPSTKVYMSDGTIREIKDVSVGDLVVGDDGLPRRVLQKFNGYAPMYLVHKNKGDDYVVTDNQCLVLRATGVGSYTRAERNGRSLAYFATCSGNKCRDAGCSKVGFRKKCPCFKSEEEAKEAQKSLISGEFDSTWVQEGNLFVMTAEQYLKICNQEARVDGLQNFKIPLPIFGSSGDLPLDPYFFGLWIGDGSKSKALITSSDHEIERYLESLAPKYGMLMRRLISKKPGDIRNGLVATKYCYDLYLQSADPNFNRFEGNPITSKLRKLNVYNNKHIPEIYMNASEEDRYRLLAGLLDTDGTLHNPNCCYEFSQMDRNKGIVYQVQILACTLGLNVSKIYSRDRPPVGRETFKDGKKFHTEYIVAMSGENTLKIPCLIERKKASVKYADHCFHSSNTSKILIQPVTGNQVHGEYVGLTVEGNDRFILSDRTVVSGSV